MSLKVPDVGELILMDALNASGEFANCEVYLYQNNYTPADNSTLAAFTIATFNGFAAQTFGFGAAATVSGRAKLTATAPCVFTCTGGGSPQTIYGYFVVDLVASEVVWAERFSSSQVMANNGDQISVTLEFTGKSEF